MNKRISRLLFVLAAFLVLLTPFSNRAQADVLQPGDRVEVTEKDAAALAQSFF